MTSMGTNSVTSFLTKLLRPDKKDKQKLPIDNKRRHSAPIPDWYEITEAGQSAANTQKLPEKHRKQHVKYASQQNLAGTKKQKHDRSKQTNKSKRQSAGFPSWFCVSGNTETLDRTPLPFSDSQSNKHNMSNSQKVTVNSEKMKGDLIPTNKGRNGRAKENRYSAPPVELSSKKSTSNGGHVEVNGKVQKTAVKKVRREVSPGVKYRTDGTLEKPYVFPAGLTFGPDGRKLQLRRTTHSQKAEEQSLAPRPNEKTVKVDVHRSSTEDIIMEYSYETIKADLGQFDVRKAFYLKYDSDFSDAITHESSVDGCDRDKQHAFNHITDRSYTYTGDTDDCQNDTYAGKIAGAIADGGNTISHEQNGNPKDRCRYSIPPKNDDLVYMGSFENVSISDYTPNGNDVSKSALNVGGNMRRSSRDTTRNRRNRYSIPTRNADLVYMGSFENVNQLLNSKTNIAPGLSLYSGTNETDDLSQCNGGEGCTASSQAQVDQPEECSTVVNDKYKSVLSGYIYQKRFDPVVRPSAIASPDVAEVTKQTSLRSFERDSVSDTDRSTKHLIIADKNTEKNASSTSRDEGSAFHAKPCEVNDENPFLTRRGRSSCMPGNTRFIAPPPAITTSYISTNSSDLNSARSSSFMHGSKTFSIPPPPNYTPPKEDMEFTYAQLKDMNCHKGSQTDLSIEFENLTMEDRDIGLQREDVKTIYAGVTTLIADDLGGDKTDCAKLNRLNNQDRAPKNNSVNLELYEQIIDVSDLSHGSDEVFQDTQSSVSEDNARTKTRRFTKFRSKLSSNLELNKLPTSSSLSLAKELDQRSLNSGSKIVNRLISSDISYKHPFLASKTTTSSQPDPLQPQTLCDRNIWTPRDKPAPAPRKIYQADSLSKKSGISGFTDTQQAFTCKVVYPVPKQRHSLTYSRSISPSNSYEPISSPIVSQDGRRSNRQHLLRTQSCDQSSTLLRRQNDVRSEVSQSVFSHNIYVSIDDEHVYDEIDPQLNVSGLNNSKIDNIYEECENIDSEKQGNKLQKSQTQNERGKNEKPRFETSLSPLQPITLSSSPGQRRRHLNPPKDQPSHSIPVSQPQQNCVMATTHVQIDAVSTRTEHGKGAVIELVDVNKLYQCDDSDNSSIADDEMSLSNEEDMEEVAKRYSLRRCVSADNLLRSGSIIDRSMILAKRRRKRMQERRSKSHLQLFSDDNYNFTKTSLKAHYTKRKRTSNERLFKQKTSHTDSGHDSEIVSPCTSPDTRRHVDNITLSQAGDSNDVGDSWVPRQGTLPRKSWEIRLRSTQHLRKCRSRESLLTPSAKMYAPSNTAFGADY